MVRDHFETFRAEAARVHDRDALPRFIEDEFRGFLHVRLRRDHNILNLVAASDDDE